MLKNIFYKNSRNFTQTFNLSLICPTLKINTMNFHKNANFNKISCFNFTEKYQNNTMELIKILRAETNSPLNHIKKALQETNNNLEEAKNWLKKKGFKDAENKMGRKAESQITVFSHNEVEGLIVLNNIVCETDFVASNKMFIDFAKILSDFVLCHKQNLTENDFSSLTLDKYLSDITPEMKNLNIKDAIKYIISKTGENCQIKNLIFTKYDHEKEFAGIYVHNSLEENVGKQGSYVILHCESNVKITENQRNKLKDFANKVAMQIIASKPRFLNKEDIPAEILQKESEIIKEGIIAKRNDTTVINKNDSTDYKNMPEDKLNKLIEKKIENWIESVCLNEQEFLIVDHDSKNNHEKVKDIVSKIGKQFGVPNVSIKEFKFY